MGLCTRSISLEASLSTGTMKRKKKTERMANPFAVRVYPSSSAGIRGSHRGKSYHNSVVPGEDGELIQPSNQIPPRSDIASYEDRKSENRERVHESLATAVTSPSCRENE
jgi:hypothetical protein